MSRYSKSRNVHGLESRLWAPYLLPRGSFAGKMKSVEIIPGVEVRLNHIFFQSEMSMKHESKMVNNLKALLGDLSTFSGSRLTSKMINIF
jgi:hypothetical protein